MKLKEALDKWWFTYSYDEETKDFFSITHCWVKCEISTMSIVMCDTIECPKCWKRLTRKRALMDECFLN